MKTRGRATTGAAVLAALLAAPLCASALDGALSGYLPAGTYPVTDDIYVPAGETLTLAPGVVFEFEDSVWEEYEFDVEGTLLAEGTVASPIIFRAAAGVPEFNYMRLATSTSVMRHCIVQDVGSVSLSS
ncbi:MAG: hypothetical protein GF400_07610, partial [Candidatus Eisenbacteria bacterium]|nr:hypothetical protein [Candidatus Eisenbacteria bacterium]